MKTKFFSILTLIVFIIGGFFVSSSFIPAYVLLSLVGIGVSSFIYDKIRQDLSWNKRQKIKKAVN